MEVIIRRVYEKVEDSGLRILVDGLWPRGIKKADLKCDIWAKNIAPSPELRRMFHADPEANWDAFAQGYLRELETSPAFAELISRIKEENPQRIILLYAFKNVVKNHAILLQQKMVEALSKEE